MTQEQLNSIVRARFVLMYRDLAIYRWSYRNLGVLKTFYLGFCFVGMVAYYGNITPWLWASWGFLFIAHVFLAGVDHFFIGIHLKKILNSLEREGIYIGLTGLLRICEPVIPR